MATRSSSQTSRVTAAAQNQILMVAHPPTPCGVGPSFSLWEKAKSSGFRQGDNVLKWPFNFLHNGTIVVPIKEPPNV